MIASLIAIALLCLILETKSQKNGFRGGSKSYEIHVEASNMGTNLHYELPESKVKAASKQDWLVDNDNAEMLAMNSPVLATVNVKHPKFSMKGQWPGYKTSFKVPKDVSVASKRTDFSKSHPGKHRKIGRKVEQHDANLSSSGEASEDQAKGNDVAGSGVILSKVAARFFKGRKTARESRHEGGLEMLNISRLLLPIAGLKNIDLKNPHVSKAMKGLIKHARKVVNEAKTVLSDAANFITRVRKLVKVTKDHTKTNRKAAKANLVTKETKTTGSKRFAVNASKYPLTKEKSRTENKLKAVQGAKTHDLKNRSSLKSKVVDQNHNKNAKRGNEGKEIYKRGKDDASAKGVSRRSNSLGTEITHTKTTEPRVKKRGLPDTLESILFTINGLKNILKYH